mgnify:FL=1
MCVGNLFNPPTPAPPPRMGPAPTVKAAAPPPEMVTPQAIRDEDGDEKLSTKKKKALEIQKVKEGVKTFSAIDPTSMPQGPEGGITPPS